jgi:small GTP-binding protein
MTTDYDYIFKVCFLGQGNVGKTSLILRYTQNAFIEDYKPTLGTDFAVKKITYKGIKVALQIWDLAGQDYFKAIRTYYSKGASAGVIVFDVTRPETFMTVKNWYDQFKQDSSPNNDSRRGGHVFLVGNKTDLVDQRVVPPEVNGMMESWLKVPTYETSAKSGTNVEQMFIDLTKILLKDLD